MTQVVMGQHSFDDNDRTVFVKLLRQVAAFYKVLNINYSVLPTHFQLLIHLPRRTPLSDTELLRRYQRLYPTYSPHLPAHIEVITD